MKISTNAHIKIDAFLTHVFLFRGMDKEEVAEIASCANIKLLKKGEILFHEGEEAPFFYIIVRGKIKISKYSRDGQEQILHLHGAGDPIAEAALFDSLRYPGTATSLEETLLVVIAKENFLGLLMKYPKLSLKMLSAYSRRLREFVHMIESLTQKDVGQRIVRFLLKEGKRREHDHVWICPLHHTKKELALMLNTSPESFSRVLSKLKKKKLIEENEEGIILLDREALKAL